MTAALEGGEWSAARPSRTLPPGKTRYPFGRRLGEPQGRSGRAENLVPTRIRSRTVQPVAQSLYRLSYEIFGTFTKLRIGWEPNIFLSIQEAHCIPWKQKVHYRFNKSPPLVPILTQINPVQALQADPRKMHFNIILISTFRSSKWCLSLFTWLIF